MIIILYDDNPYEGYYIGCIEVPDDFDLSAKVKAYRQHSESIGKRTSVYDFVYWLQEKYESPKKGVLEIGTSHEGLRITQPSDEEAKPKQLNEF